MKFNDIKFVPKANAVADAYAKATGVPFIGEMMVAAAGNTPTGSGDEGGGGDDDQSHIYYVAYTRPTGSDEDYTESSDGTATMTDTVENGYRSVIINTSSYSDAIVDVHVWIDADAAVDDGEYWSIYTDSQGNCDIDMLDVDVKIYSTMPQ